MSSEKRNDNVVIHLMESVDELEGTFEPTQSSFAEMMLVVSEEEQGEKVRIAMATLVVAYQKETEDGMILSQREDSQQLDGSTEGFLDTDKDKKGDNDDDTSCNDDNESWSSARASLEESSHSTSPDSDTMSPSKIFREATSKGH